MSNQSPSLSRQMWLEAATEALRKHFVCAGYVVPDAVRVSIGWPKGGGTGHTIGQCFSVDSSSDAHNEIFISPELGTESQSIRIMGVLAHELVHATVGHEAGHKKPFKRCAVAIGLTGKMTATTEGDDFIAWGNKVIERIGPYPAGTLHGVERKKQSTRLLKCECSECGYTARITKKWIESAGAPICPTDQIEMSCDAVGGDGDDE